MAVSIAAMTVAELQAWMALHPVYVTVAEAVQAGALVATPASGVGGVAITTAEAASAVADATVTGSTILDFAEAAELLSAGTKVKTAGTGLLHGSTGYKLSAVLGVDVGIIGAAVAPVLGVALGVNLYESNPELWTKLSQRLLPFCYPGTTKIPTWAEVGETAWRTSVLKRVVDAVKDLFDEEEIGKDSGWLVPEDMPIGTLEVVNAASNYSPGVTTYNGTEFTWPNYTYSSGVWTVLTTGTVGTEAGVWIVGVGDSPDQVLGYDQYGNEVLSNSSFTHNGKTVYYWASQDGFTWSRWVTMPSPLTPYYPSSGNECKEIAWTIKYGNYQTGGYPEGTSHWDGTTPSTIPLGSPAVVNPDGTEEATVPISIPQEVPQTRPSTKPTDWPEELPAPLPVPSSDPATQPDPTTTTDPQKQVEPYIIPSPIPWEIYAPDPSEETQTDPTLDPTTPRPPTETITNPPIDLGPSPIGISPWPVMPGTPMAFAQNVGLITVYHPTPAQLYDFESWLWVTLSQADINTVWNNPFDGVIGLFELYCTPTDVGSRTIHSGFLDSGINSAIISRYTEINCGTYAIPEYYGNYLDYSPYSKAHVYLPFIGVQELNVDDIVGHAVNITYRIDEYNGSCIAMITVAKTTEVNGETVEYRNTMYQFSGNCAVELPISGGSQASIKAGLMMANAYQTAANISAGANLIGGVGSLLMGSIGGAISGLGQATSSYAYGQANALSNMLSGKSTVQKSGQFGSSYGAMGIKNPFITITRPKQIQVPNYNDLYGYPAHKMVTIGSCTGFLRCREVHVISPTASDEEKSLIENLLKSGVYVTE